MVPLARSHGAFFIRGGKPVTGTQPPTRPGAKRAMEVELAEIRDFLQRCAPFDRLPDDVLDRLPRMLQVTYLRRGSSFPPDHQTDSGYAFIVRSGAVELRDADGELLDKLAECDIYAGRCGENSGGPDLRGAAVEDTLLYLLACESFQRLQDAYPDFNEHFHDSIRVRLQGARRGLFRSDATAGGLFQTKVRELVNRPPVYAPPDINIQAAAQLMTEQGVSALMIMDADRLAGLVTDRDLRSRCIAEGRPSDAAIDSIMTRTLHTIAADASGFEALTTMAQRNIHHLPVMDHGSVIGLVSNTDLIRQQSRSALHVVDEIRKCDSPAALRQACPGLRELFRQLVEAGTGLYHLGKLVSSVTDSATRRLLELAEQELGPAPVRYAWMAAGSQARQEQSVLSDQDNALLLDDDFRADAHDAYFRELAAFVNDGLNDCGLRYCPGEVMARNDQWRQPVQVWRGYFSDWIENPTRKALMLSANFFDMRPVAGAVSLYEALHAHVLQQTRANHIFLAHLVAIAVEDRPPLGFFRNLVLDRSGEHVHTLDLKRGGVMPIVNLARVAALANGSPDLNTFDRLRNTAGSADLSSDAAADLEDALEIIGILRARHQARQIRRGQAPDNFLSPDELTARERAHLKDAFAVIKQLQAAFASRFQSDRFA